MKLFKSIFWLSIAYLAIGPHVNAVETVSEISRQTVVGGSQLIASQMNQVECRDLACVGGKLAVTSTLSMLPPVSEPTDLELGQANEIPFPRPRLDRT